MTRTVADAAAMLAVMAGSDPQDAATRDADAKKIDYSTALSRDALQGKRLGVMKFAMGYLSSTDAAFWRAVERLKSAGATVIDIDTFEGLDRINRDELTVLLTDLRTELNAYLGATPSSVAVKTLKDLIAFNEAHAAVEMPYFGQDLFEQAEKTATHNAAAYQKLRAGNRQAAVSTESTVCCAILDRCADRANDAPGVRCGSDERRSHPRRCDDACSGVRISASDGADGRRSRVTNRAVVCRSRLVGRGVAGDGLCVRTTGQCATKTHLRPEHFASRDGGRAAINPRHSISNFCSAISASAAAREKSKAVAVRDRCATVHLSTLPPGNSVPSAMAHSARRIRRPRDVGGRTRLRTPGS